MAIPVNPYIAGNPVGDSPAFVGRTDVLREVLRVLRLPHSNAIVLYGQRRIGKTSILQHLAAQLPQEGPYHPVYFDLQDKAAWPLGRVLRDMARAIAHGMRRTDPGLGERPERFFRETWFPTVLAGLPEDHSLVLLFDEFDVLADPQAEQAAATLFPYLRHLLATAGERLQIVFVIGRNMDDLDTIALSLFKGTPSRRVSLMERRETMELVRISEVGGTLRWTDEALERVWQLTNGHPYLTQQLCSHVWGRAYDAEPQAPPLARGEDVEAAIPDALEASHNALGWLWDGLPPAACIVASALAQAGSGPISQAGLERILRESGVRVVIRELQNAPNLLHDWDLIEPSANGYRFRVEMLRRWVVEQKPLSRVQDELDRIEPVAENLYQAACGLYQGRELAQAAELLRQAVAINPNHIGANQLLADISLARGHAEEAVELLERLYEYRPRTARPRLIQALLALAQAAEREEEKLALYERVLELDLTQAEAIAGRRRIWKERGDAAFAADDLTAALEAYQLADLSGKVVRVELEIRRRELRVHLKELQDLKEAGQHQAAMKLARQLSERFPETPLWHKVMGEVHDEALDARLEELRLLEQAGRHREALALVREMADDYAEQDWSADLERLEGKARLPQLYQQASRALRSGDWEAARSLLAHVVSIDPAYADGEAARRLLRAVRGGEWSARWRRWRPYALAGGCAVIGLAAGAMTIFLLVQLTMWLSSVVF